MPVWEFLLGMLSQSVCVIALDGADFRLVREWELENLQLDSNARIETFTYSKEHPATIEIWPTVATGVSPAEHGLTPGDKQQEWQNPALKLASSIGGRIVPKFIRNKIGLWLLDHSDYKHELGQTDQAHVFDDVDSWVGVTPAYRTAKMMDLVGAVATKNLTHKEFRKAIEDDLEAAVSYASGQTKGIVGVHIHALDAAGHLYSEDKETLKHYYKLADKAIADIRDSNDDVIVLSDHGMQVSWLNDKNPGVHSRHAYISSTEGISGEFPEKLTDVAEWIDSQRPPEKRQGIVTVSNRTKEHLEELGYK